MHMHVNRKLTGLMARRIAAWEPDVAALQEVPTAGIGEIVATTGMRAVWTTTGTFMLMFLAALQDLPIEVDEAALLDGVSPWQKLRMITLPMIKPTLFLVITLGLIGTWQVFDQIYVMGKGAPAGTTLTPAFLSYKQSFTSLQYGSGAAMAFIVFLLIIALTLFQRWLMSDNRSTRRSRRTAGVAVATSRGQNLGGPVR